MPRSLRVVFLLALFLYLSLYTWNLRTGYLDDFASNTGLQFVGWVLLPGEWSMSKLSGFWGRYVDLVHVSQDNEELRRKLDWTTGELAKSKEEAALAQRLRTMLTFAPPTAWTASGARVVATRFGPNAAQVTIMIDKGYRAGAGVNTPAATSAGVVGRIVRVGPFASTVLLLTDAKSRIAVLGQTNRTTGILSGKGPNFPLQVQYVPLDMKLVVGEILVTSGLDDIFPKGVPVAKVVKVERSDISLFQTVWAEPTVDLRNIEEVLLLMPESKLDTRPELSPDAAPGR